eukprot:gene24607-29728_t
MTSCLEFDSKQQKFEQLFEQLLICPMGTVISKCSCRKVNVRKAVSTCTSPQSLQENMYQHAPAEESISDVLFNLLPASLDTMDNTPSPNIDQPCRTLSSQHLPLLSANSHDLMAKTEAKEIFDQLFLLTETGLLSTLKFLIVQFPNVKHSLNDSKSVCLGDFSSDLTLVQFAVCLGHCDIVRYFLSLPEVFEQVVDPKHHMSLVHLAVYFEQPYCLYVLLRDTRLDVLTQDITGKTALHWAVQQRYDIGVDSLLSLASAADYHNVKDCHGNTVLHVAARYPDEGIARMLVRHLTSASFSGAIASSSASERVAVGWRKKPQFFDAKNADGLTAMALLENTITWLESRRRLSDASSSSAMESKGHGEVDRQDSGELSAATYPTIASFRKDSEWMSQSSQDVLLADDLAVCRECLRIFLEAAHWPVDGDGVAVKDMMTTTESLHNEQSSDESACAFSWSPANELKMQNRLAARRRKDKSRTLDSSAIDKNLRNVGVFTSPLAISID